MIDYCRIKKPTLLLNEIRCRENIRTMSMKAKTSGVIFRPHFKTHQSATIGEWFREAGINSITVSSVTMALYFAHSGWEDITVAFPFNIRELTEAQALAEKVRLNILVSDYEQTRHIIRKIKFQSGCFLKINTGLNRSGIDWNDRDQIWRITELIKMSPYIRFRGFLTHSGHTYKASGIDEIFDIYRDTLFKLSSLRPEYNSPGIIFSTGDTPSCSLVSDFSGFDEIRPGNFIFYDLTQMMLGSCKADQVAVAVACPVVEKNYNRKEIIIYGGGVHLSKESIRLSDGRIVFGEAVLLNDEGWQFPAEGCFLRSLSQEHGIIAASDELMNNVKVGELLGIIPVHSCLTADLMRRYHTFEDKEITDFSPK